MKLKRCLEHDYTLKSFCDKCGKKTDEGHYRFIKIRDVKDKTN